MIRPIPPQVPDIYADFGKYKKDIEVKEKEPSFSELLKAAIERVNALQNESAEMNKKLALGEVEDIHQVMIAGEKAAIALELTIEIRNKVVEAYQSIMRLNV